jgi:predicted phage terminase large subunit-like protein
MTQVLEPRTKVCALCGEDKPVRHYADKARPECIVCGDKAQAEALSSKTQALREHNDGVKQKRKKVVAARASRNHHRKKSRAKKALAAREERKQATAERKVQERKLDRERKLEIARKEALAKQEVSREIIVRREIAARELSRKHLMPYILRMHPNYLAGWVHKDVALRLERFSEQVANGESPRLMLQMPPRTGKSQEASIYFPSWHLGKYPTHEIMACSYSAALVLGFSRKVRGLLRDEDYHKLFPGAKLDPDNQNAEGWQTNKGGGFMPVGVGGPATGRGASILLIDDPVKNSEEAESQTVRQSIKDWYASTAYTRLAPGGGVLVIQTRWHEDDLSGWLEQQMLDGEGDEFEIVRYPAIAMEDEKYRFKGEALHPERYDEKALARIKRAVGPRVWDALYQQHPTSEEGGYFSSDMVKLYDESQLPEDLVYYTAWDFAVGKKERNDFTVGLTVGIDHEENIWVVGLTHGRMDTFEIVNAMLDTYVRYGERLVGMEKGHISMSFGPYLEQQIKERKLFAFPAHELNPGRRDKELRARSIQGRMRQGRVFFPRDASWMDKLRQELMGFPFSKHDDIVDALAWIGLMLQDIDVPHIEKPKKKKSWTDRLHKHFRGQVNKRGNSAMAS